MNNEVANILKGIFNDLTFVPRSFASMDSFGVTVSHTQYYGNNYSNAKVKATIYLNDSLLSFGSKEVILVTMLHEVLHAYLALKYVKSGQSQFIAKYPEFAVYVQDI